MLGFIRIFKVMLIVLPLAACTPQYNAQLLGQGVDLLELRNQVRLHRNQEWRLGPDTALYIAMAKNKLIPRTELTITESLYDALLEHFPMSMASTSPATLDEALAAARARDLPITVFHQLSDRQDKLSSWAEIDGDMNTGVPWGRDRLRLQIQLYDSYSGQLMDSAYISSVSRRVAFSNVNPDELLRLAAQEFATGISSVPGQAL
ncbi:MAG: DUF4823 domain-containing protein [Cellvibrionaceae bacterium]|nr:DUF4823 domain-containing protein [Cellvibrionaceae bacterium]MCV6624843.1 DUF4823 domain-containing protein [Cellvibrionaceae bacterium]